MTKEVAALSSLCEGTATDDDLVADEGRRPKPTLRAAAPPGLKRCAATQARCQAALSAVGQSHRGQVRILSGIGLFAWRLAWRLTALQPGHHLAELARGLEGLQSDIGVVRGRDAAMAEHTANEFIVARIRLEDDVGGGMAELMRSDLSSPSSFQSRPEICSESVLVVFCP